MAGGAVNVVSLPSAFQILGGDRKREHVGWDAVDFPRIQQFVSPQFSPCDGARNRRTLRPVIAEKLAVFVVLIFRLNVHVQPAASHEYSTGGNTNPPQADQGSQTCCFGPARSR